MKHILLTIFFISSFGILQGQTDFKVKFNHLLGQQDFQYTTGAQNNIGHDFEVTRLEYYLSGFKIIHDGGQVLEFNDTYLLVNGDDQEEHLIGQGEVQVVESIQFSIGVDPSVNNGDPTLWPSSHPLAPKFPSMHWGWAAGYRFIAIEGNGGAGYNQLFQLHGLGNDNYFEVNVDVNEPINSDVVVINLDADYTRVLENMSVNGGLIVHGDYAEAKESLENMRDFVFELSSLSTSTKNNFERGELSITPNPTFSSSVFVESNGIEFDELMIYDMKGSLLESLKIDGRSATHRNEVVLPSTGTYMLNFLNQGTVVESQLVLSK